MRHWSGSDKAGATHNQQESKKILISRAADFTVPTRISEKCAGTCDTAASAVIGCRRTNSKDCRIESKSHMRIPPRSDIALSRVSQPSRDGSEIESSSWCNTEYVLLNCSDAQTRAL